MSTILDMYKARHAHKARKAKAPEPFELKRWLLSIAIFWLLIGGLILFLVFSGAVKACGDSTEDETITQIKTVTI